jgi:hypothetical protein
VERHSLATTVNRSIELALLLGLFTVLHEFSQGAATIKWVFLNKNKPQRGNFPTATSTHCTMPIGFKYYVAFANHFVSLFLVVMGVPVGCAQMERLAEPVMSRQLFQFYEFQKSQT